MKSKLYENITGIEFLGTCSDPEIASIARKMWLIGNKRKIRKILESYGAMAVGEFTLKELEKCYNPYHYYISRNYINVVHSSIDHLFKIERDTD